MKVGITVWGKRISPVFDAARTLLISDIANARQLTNELVQCRPGQPEEMLRLLLDNGVKVLITGAISREPAGRIEACGIQLIPFIAGRADQVLARYVEGTSITGYHMPGCCNSAGNGHGRGQRCRKGQLSMIPDRCDTEGEL
jgi:predicted Fe-Mo cluster-binding NifX family protein